MINEKLAPGLGEHELDAAPAVPRARLIDATIDSIHRHGLARTTLATVAKGAGVAPSLINFHFKSKDALLLATLEAVAEAFDTIWRAAIERAPDEPAAQLSALVKASFEPASRDVRALSVWNAFWGEATARADYQRICGAIEDAHRREVVRLCHLVAVDGGYRGIDPDAIGVAVHCLITGLPEDALQDPDGFDWAAARRTAFAFLASVYVRHFDMPAGMKAGTRASDALTNAPPAHRETLPSWVYQDPEFLDLEKEHIFRRNWILVGHMNEMPGPGDYLTLDMVDERVLVIRDRDGRLNGFHNVCRHRAARVVAGRSGTCKRAITCPYHGWTYGFDGSLTGVPAQGTFGDFDRARHALPPVEVEEWMGFVFVRLGGSGPSVGEQMQPFETELAPYRFAEMEPYGQRWELTMEVNWKTVLDNDKEGYHVPVGHPGLQRMFGNSYYDEAFDRGVSRSYSKLREAVSPAWSEGHYQRLLPEATHLPDDLRRVWLYYGLFPNLSVGVYPDQVSYFQVFPITPAKCVLRGHAYALPDERRTMRAARWLNDRINTQVWREDRNLVYWADAGLRSSSYESGVLSDKECAVGQFHDQIREALPVAHTRTPPRPGQVAAANRDCRMVSG